LRDGTAFSTIHSMLKYKAIIDTNVLYSGLYSSSGASYQILSMIEEGYLTPVLSTALLFEYEEVLTRNKHKLNLSSEAIDDVLNGFCSRAEYRKIYFLWRPQLSDPKDDHILELAVAASGIDIITHNVRDFARAKTFGVRIVTPKTLLGELK